MGSTPEVQRHVSAAAARLNCAESEADFLTAAELFQAALDVEPDCEAAAYGLEQAQKGQQLAQQQRSLNEKASTHWSLRAGRSAAAGFSMLREGAQRSIAELSELAGGSDLLSSGASEPSGEPEPEPELEPEQPPDVPSSITVHTEDRQTLEQPEQDTIEDTTVENFLSQVDTLMQELDADEDEEEINDGAGGSTTDCARVTGASSGHVVAALPAATDAPVALGEGLSSDIKTKENPDISESPPQVEAIE